MKQNNEEHNMSTKQNIKMDEITAGTTTPPRGTRKATTTPVTITRVIKSARSTTATKMETKKEVATPAPAPKVEVPTAVTATATEAIVKLNDDTKQESRPETSVLMDHWATKTANSDETKFNDNETTPTAPASVGEENIADVFEDTPAGCAMIGG